MAMFLLYFFPFIMLLSGVISFVSKRTHLLSTLLSLEFIVLILFYFLLEVLSLMDYENFFGMVFLTFSVCEGALGLSVLVSLVRTHGNDYFQTFSVLQC
uniref:NADH-ubiquinone oxidoreductase chain 4L n=1 Tax=Austrosimulium sp. TaxID=3073296 RepID=A0AA51NP32_9DIPT|nr:NADH dehydrogenase subunit 4L [Austrosimulium sp.]